MSWLKQIGYAVGLGMAWAAAWLPFGVLAGFVFDPDGSMDEPWPLIGVYPGFISAVFFSLLLRLVERGRPLAALPPGRALLLGVAAGFMVVALPFLFADAEGGPRTFPVVPILTAIVVLSGLSAMLSTSCARRLGSPGARV
jgi:hypothetical protein